MSVFGGPLRAATRLCAVALLAGCMAQAAPETVPGGTGAIRIDARAVPFHTGDPEIELADRLRFRGGFALTSPDPRFGGFSGLHVTPDGSRLIAVSDKGWWLDAPLRYGADGRLAGVGAGRIGPLRDPEDRPLTPRGPNDVEALARLPGGFAVAFEGWHRIWFYPDGPDGAPFGGRPQALTPPPGLSAARDNRGIEALAALPDGRLVAVTEGLAAGPQALRGWIGDGKGSAWRPFAWARSAGFDPSDATALPDGDLLILERRFTFIGGFAARLVRVRPEALRPGPAVSGETLGTIAPPHMVDNFEAVAARRGPRGETLIYLLADDNYQPLEKTLLFMLELLPAP